MRLGSPEQIYAELADEIDRILGALRASSTNHDVAEVQTSVKDLLRSIQEQLVERLDGLRKHEEWDTFTIAVYGETNAGKSTLIETLRILLGEQGKVSRRRAFKAVQDEHALSPEALEACRVEIAQSSQAIDTTATLVSAQVDELHQREQVLLAQLNLRQAQVADLQRKAPFWKKWLHRLRKPTEMVALEKAQLDCQAFNVEKPGRVAEINRANVEAGARFERANSLSNRQAEALVKLEPFADGEIIGDGRSDFTRTTASYLFEVGGQKFALLDVPGIEGDERGVTDQIWNAVSKAHAVLYITSKAAAPQRGEPGMPGTLEKIKAHLNDQTEVWTIFNKRATNPLHLARPPLVSDDEEASLGVLDTKMREHLGENYQQHVSLSAMPAFWSVADCLVPGSSDDKSRTKFLAKMPPEELLDKTGMTQFLNLLTNDFIKDYQGKIHRANFNKAGKLVAGAVDRLSAMRHDHLDPLYVKLKQDTDSARDQISIKLASLGSDLESQVQMEIDRFTRTVRHNVYAHIDTNIDNDQLKQALAAAITAGQVSMADALPHRLEEAVSRFNAEIEEVVGRFLEFAQELLELYGKINIEGLNRPVALTIKIDTGVKLRGLLSAVMTVISLAAFPPAGILLAVIGVLFTFGKAIWSAFDDDFKKSQQRRAVNDHLRRVVASMRESAFYPLRESFELVTAKVHDLSDALAVPVEHLQAIGETLGKSISELTLLSHEISNTAARP